MSLAYLLDRFGVPSETFIVREIEGLRRLGIRPKLWALRPVGDRAPSEGTSELARDLRVLPPPVSLRAAAAKLVMLLRSPVRFLDAGVALLGGTARAPRTFLPELFRAGAAYHLARELERQGVTHLHAHFGFIPSTVAWFAWRLSGIPYSVSVHAWDIFANRSMMPEKLLAARRVVTCTDYARRFLLEKYPVLDPKCITCVHHGLDTDRYAPEATPGGSVTRLLAVGRLVPKKGFGVLLGAFARARAALAGEGRKVVLTLVGDGPERPRLEREARELDLGESLRMTGALPPDEVRTEMGRAHVLVVPSVPGPRGDLDGLPNVVLEAMALARPVVGSRLSGIPEAVFDGRTGLLVPPGDDQVIAGAVVRLARDPTLASRLGAAGRKLVEERFSLETSARALEAVFREMGALG